MDIGTILSIIIGVAIVAFVGRQVYLRWRVTSIGVEEAKARIGNGNVTVLDVRQPHEYEAGHIRNAVLVPLGEVNDRAEEAITRDDDVIVVVCASGNRSLSAASKLMNMGYEQVVNLKGGMNAWQSAGLPTEKGQSRARHRR